MYNPNLTHTARDVREAREEGIRQERERIRAAVQELHEDTPDFSSAIYNLAIMDVLRILDPKEHQ